MVLSAGDWALKRFLKFILKRKLGKYLHELDMEALDVEIGTGKVELRQLLLKCDQLTADLSLQGWEVRACYLGSVKAQLPFSALGWLSGDCSVSADEVILIVAATQTLPPPKHNKIRQAGNVTDPDSQAASDPLWDELSEPGSDTPTTGMDEIIRRIANGLHTILQQLSVSVTDILVRVEFPLPPTNVLPQASPEVGIVSITVDRMSLTDGSDEKPSSQIPGQEGNQQQQQGGWWSGQATRNKSVPTAAGNGTAGLKTINSTQAKQVRKVVSVEGVSIQLYTGPALQTSSSSTESSTVDSIPTTSQKKPLHPPLLSGPDTEHGIQGVSCTLTVSVTSSHAQPPPVQLQAGYTTSTQALPAAVTATQVECDVQLGPCLLRLMPEHIPVLNAIKSHASFLQTITTPASQTRAHETSSALQGVQPLQHSMQSPLQGYDRIGTDDVTTTHHQQLHSTPPEPWGTSSLLGSFLLDDYKDLVAHSLHPYVTQSLSMADSVMPEWANWHQHNDEHEDASLGYSRLMPPSNGHHQAAVSWQNSQPYEDLDLNQSFHDAHSEFSSYPPSAANSIHSAMQVPELPVAVGQQTSGSATNHMSATLQPQRHTYTNGHQVPTHQHPVTQQQSPPRIQRRPPEYQIKVVIDEVQLFVGFGPPSSLLQSRATSGQAGGVVHSHGLLITLTELLLQGRQMSGHLAGSVEVQQFQAMELIPIDHQSSDPSIQTARACGKTHSATHHHAYEFAAIPSKLHKALHCFRPDPTWLQPPSWIQHNTGKKELNGGMQPVLLKQQAAGTASVVCWPVLYCGGGLKSAGVRPCLTIRASKQTSQSDTYHQGNSNGYINSGVHQNTRQWSGNGTSAAHDGVADGLYENDDGHHASTRQPGADALRLQLEMLPMTVWLCPDALQRISTGFSRLSSACAVNSSSSTGNGCKQTTKPSGNTTSKLPELEVSVSIPHVCVLARASVTTQHGVSSALPKHEHMYVLLDVLCPSHHDHVSHQRVSPHQGPPLIRLVCGRKPGELVTRYSANAEVAIARARLYVVHPSHAQDSTDSTPRSIPTPTLRAPHNIAVPGRVRWVTSCLLEVGPRSCSSPVASSGHEPATGLGICTGAQDLPPGCGIFASLLWDPQGPCAQVTGQEVVNHIQHYVAAHSASRWNDGESDEGDGETDSTGFGGRSSPGPGSCRSVELQERCRRSSHAFLRLCLSSVTLDVTDQDLGTLSRIATAWQPAEQPQKHKDICVPDREVMLSAKPDSERVQVMILAHAQLNIKLRPINAVNNGLEQLSHSPSPLVASETSLTPCFSLTMEEISLTHVSGMTGTHGSMLLAVSAQGLCLKRLSSSHASQLAKSHRAGTASVMLQGSDRHTRTSQFKEASSNASGRAYEQDAWWQAPPDYDQCLLYCPLHATGRGSSAAQPCLDVVVFKGPTPLTATFAKQDQPSVVSVLVRGITISTDYGNLTMNWLQQLTTLLTPPKSDQQNCSKHAAAANENDVDSTSNEPAMQLVVSLQDIALRHEPLPYPTSAIAASYVSARLPEKASTGKQAADSAELGGSSVAGQQASNGDKGKARPTPSPVAMVLIAEHVRYESGASHSNAGHHAAAGQTSTSSGTASGLQQHLVVINSVGLHLALAHCRGAGWEPETACDVAGSKLQSYGYHCVLSESTLRVSIQVPTKPTSGQTTGTDSQGASVTDVSTQNAPEVDINIWNQQVLGVLTQDSAALLIQLSAQLGAYIAAATAPPLESINKIALSRAGSNASQLPHRSASSGSCNSTMLTSTTSAIPSVSSTPIPPVYPATATGSSVNGVTGNASSDLQPSESGYEAITQKTEQLMRELLASNQHFRVGNGTATSSTDLQPSSSQACPNGSIKSGYSTKTTVSGGSRVHMNRGQQQSGWYNDPPQVSAPETSASDEASLTPGVIIIDDFFDVPSERPGSDDSGDDMPYDWEVMRTSTAAVGSPQLGGPPFHNSPPEASGVWYSPGHNSPNRTSLDQSHVAPFADTQQHQALDSADHHIASSHRTPIKSPSRRGPSMHVHEDYVSTHSSSTAAPAAGLASQLAVSSRTKPTPSLRVTFNNFAGMSVLHTTRGSGGVQAGRVEAEVEGATLVIEMYPQGGHDARLLHLSVRDLEIRDCRAQQRGSGQHHGSMSSATPYSNNNAQSSSDCGPLPYLVPEACRTTSSGGWSASSGVDARRSGSFSAAARVRSGLANGVGVAAQAASVTLGGAAKLATGRTEPKKWIKILSYRHKPDRPRDSRSAQLEVVMESVRPDPEAHPTLEEMRLQVALLPVRLRLDQDVLQYLVAFAQAVMNPHTASALALLGQLQLAAQSGGDAAALPFFQMVQLTGLELVIDYRPRRIDVAALRAGSLMELCAMIPLGGLELSMSPVFMSGVAGWDQLGAAVARQWITHIAQTQAHKFLLGLAPVHALVRVGGAVSAVLNAPPVTRGVSRGIALAATAAAVPLSGIRKLQEGRMATQVREGVVAFTRLLVAEALAKSNTMANGAQQYLSSTGKQSGQQQPPRHTSLRTMNHTQQTGQPEMLIAYAQQPTSATVSSQPQQLQDNTQGPSTHSVRQVAGQHVHPKPHSSTAHITTGTSTGTHSGHHSGHTHRKPLTHHLGKGLHKIGKAANKISKSLSLGSSSSSSSSSTRHPISMRALHTENRSTSSTNSAVESRSQPAPTPHVEGSRPQQENPYIPEASHATANQAGDQQLPAVYQAEPALPNGNAVRSMHTSHSNLSDSNAAHSISFMSSSRHTADIDSNGTTGQEMAEPASELAPMLPLSSLLNAIELVVGEYPPQAHAQKQENSQPLADSQLSFRNSVHAGGGSQLLPASTSQADLLGIGQNSGLDIASTANPHLQSTSQPVTQPDALQQGTASARDSIDLLGIEDLSYSTGQPATSSTVQSDVRLNLIDFSSQPPVRVASSTGIKQRSVGASHSLSPHADSSPMYSATSNTNSNDTWEDVTSTKPGLGLLLDHAVASSVGHAGTSSGSLTSGDWVALSETVTARTSDSMIAGGVVLVSMEKEKTKRD